jgi:tetratricopeptide (TPR) repeat protein
MAGTSNKFSRFWQELKRRKTDRVLVIYAATAFTILQVAEPIKSGLSLPDWTTTFIIIVLAVGFPIAAIFSWIFDITPGGIEKTKPESERKRHTTEAELRKWKSTTLISVIVIIALLFYNIIRGTALSGSGKAEASLTVEPFRCIDDEEELVRNGIVFTESINGALASIENIDLRAWPSNSDYKEKDKSFREIARDLNVSFILKGTLNKNNFSNKIILIVQLIKATSQSLLWGNNYVIEPELKNMNAIKNDITYKISEKLNANLSDKERRRISKKLSNNPDALRNYYEGNAATQRIIFNTSTGNKFFDKIIDSKFFENAINSFDLAIAQDSSFALAYAKRAIIRSWAYYTEKTDNTAIGKCKADIDKAIELDKDLVETKIALGFYYYYCTFENDKALDSFNQANSQQPNNWQCLYYMALVHRALGNWHKSQKLFAKVLKFNPQDPLVLTNIGLSESMLRNYDNAISYHNRAIEIAPSWIASYSNKIDAIILRDGKTAEAIKVLDTALLKTNNDMRSFRIQFDIFDGKYEDALHEIELSEPSDFLNDRGERLSTYGDIYRYLKDNNAAVTFYKSAVAFYKEKLTKAPKNCRYLGSLGLAYACLNNKADAVESGLNAVELSRNNLNRFVDRKLDLAKIYVMLGEYDKCLEQLDYLLRNPSNISAKLLQLDPFWNPIKESPKFKKMISNYSLN